MSLPSLIRSPPLGRRSSLKACILAEPFWDGIFADLRQGPPTFLPSITTSCYGVARHKQFCTATLVNLTPTRTRQTMLDAVIAVISNGEKFLFIQRAPNIRGGGHWAPVSGEVEAGESQEAAVAREAMEEVSLTVRPASPGPIAARPAMTSSNPRL